MTQEWKPQQEAGVALILGLIEAARVIAARPGVGLGNMFRPEEAELVTHSQMLDGAIAQLVTPRPAWRAGTWEEVATLGQYETGTQVRLGAVEAVVESAVIQDWHMDPQSNPRYPRPMAHRVVYIRLEGREKPYSMPPDGAVEILDVVYPESTLASWLAAAGAVLECQAMEALKDQLGAEESGT